MKQMRPPIGSYCSPAQKGSSCFMALHFPLYFCVPFSSLQPCGELQFTMSHPAVMASLLRNLLCSPCPPPHHSSLEFIILSLGFLVLHNTSIVHYSFSQCMTDAVLIPHSTLSPPKKTGPETRILMPNT